jgi:hypothetical protein
MSVGEGEQKWVKEERHLSLCLNSSAEVMNDGAIYPLTVLNAFPKYIELLKS